MTKKTRATISIVVAVVAMLLVFYSSSMPYQDQSLVTRIQQVVPNQPFAEFLSRISFTYAGKVISIPNLGYAQFIEFFIRKGVHFLIYCFIAYHWTRGLKVHLRKRSWGFGLALFITILYAITDEFHQGLTPGRTPLVQDMLLDSVGALFGATIAYFKR